jgi:hypothetical protein
VNPFSESEARAHREKASAIVFGSDAEAGLSQFWQRRLVCPLKIGG